MIFTLISVLQKLNKVACIVAKKTCFLQPLQLTFALGVVTGLDITHYIYKQAQAKVKEFKIGRHSSTSQNLLLYLVFENKRKPTEPRQNPSSACHLIYLPPPTHTIIILHQPPPNLSLLNTMIENSAKNCDCLSQFWDALL